MKPFLSLAWLLVRIMGVTSWNPGTNWRNLYAAAILKNDGTVSALGAKEFGGDNDVTSNLKDIAAVFSTGGAMIGLRKDKTLTSWGSSEFGANETLFKGIANIKTVFTGIYDISLLHEDNTVTCIHKVSLALYGNEIEKYIVYPVNISDTAEIYSNNRAFVGVTKIGVAKGWGTASSGGILPPTLGKVKAIYASGDAFVGHQVDGKLRSWGQSVAGGCEDVKYNNEEYTCMPLDIEGVITVFSNAFAFAALVEENMSIVAWGRTTRGGDIGEKPITNVGAVFSTRYAFAALKNDGTVYAWGDPLAGGNNSVPLTLEDVVTIFASEKAFVALKKDRTIAIWGTSGGNLPSGLTEVQTVFANYQDFAALHTDGTVTSWGQDQTTKLQDVTYVYGNMQSFIATHNDGTISAWSTQNFEAKRVGGVEDVNTVYMTDITYSASIDPNFYTCPQFYTISRDTNCTDRHGGAGGGGGTGTGTSDDDDAGNDKSSGKSNKDDLAGLAIGCAVLFSVVIVGLVTMQCYKSWKLKADLARAPHPDVGMELDNPMMEDPSMNMPPPPPPPQHSEGPPSRQTAIFDSDSIYHNDDDDIIMGQRPSFFANEDPSAEHNL